MNRIKTIAVALSFVLIVIISAFSMAGCSDELLTELENELPSIPEFGEFFAPQAGTVAGDEIGFDEAQGIFCCVDVDQADCLLLVSGDDCVVIDAGNAGYGKDIAQLMYRLGVEDIDMLICTHPHADHIGSADELIALFETDVLVYAETPADMEYDYEQWDAVIGSAILFGVEEQIVKAGDVLQVGDIKMTVLSPFGDETYNDLNDYSISLFIEMCGTTIFTGGDITDNAEENLLGAYPWLYADIFKLNHHGSGGSNSRVFVRALNPRYVCVSCGRNNSYGHPHERVTDLLRELKLKTHRTDREGSIFYLIKDGNICVKTENAARY